MKSKKYINKKKNRKNRTMKKPNKKYKLHPKKSLPSKTRKGLPSKTRKVTRKDGALYFPDYPTFRPNLTPKQVIRMGSFGGTYFRPISSRITGKSYKNVHKEFPDDWFRGLDIKKMVTSEKCYPEINKYGVRAGLSLKEWEDSKWIKAQDPYGWFQWYCRFYQGRRTSDDKRQIGRWENYTGEKRGRWLRNLVGKIKRGSGRFDDEKISPVIRQGLQHWGYILTEKDYLKFK